MRKNFPKNGYKEYGPTLVAMMQDQGVSIRGLAELSGVSKEAIANYRQGRQDPSRGQMIKLAKALDLPIERFF